MGYVPSLVFLCYQYWLTIFTKWNRLIFSSIWYICIKIPKGVLESSPSMLSPLDFEFEITEVSDSRRLPHETHVYTKTYSCIHISVYVYRDTSRTGTTKESRLRPFYRGTRFLQGRCDVHFSPSRSTGGNSPDSIPCPILPWSLG